MFARRSGQTRYRRFHGSVTEEVGALIETCRRPAFWATGSWGA
jgi:hypothetical protein